MKRAKGGLTHVHVYLLHIISVMLTGFACGNSAQPQPTGEEGTVAARNTLAATPTTAAPACRESGGKTPVSIAWKETLGAGAVKRVGDLLAAQVVNNSRVAQKGSILITAAGLDGRVVKRELATFSLDPGATQEVSLPVKALPVQSEVATSLAALQVELDGPVGKIHPSRTSNIHYIFGGGYARAEFYTPAEAHRLPNGGLRTANPMDVRGRVADASGLLQEVATSSAATGGGGSRQGLAAVNVAPKDWVSYADGIASIVPKATKAPMMLLQDITENIHVDWLVGYSDVGLGEDFLVSAWPSYAWASFASLIISSTDWQTYYYYGQLDGNADTGNIDLPASTTLYATVYTYTRDNSIYSAFSSVYDDGYGEGLVSVTFPFETGSGGGYQGLAVPFNDEAIQVAAVTGFMQRRNLEIPTELGIAAQEYFLLHTNKGCPDGNGGFENLVSCASSPIGIYYGPSSGGWQEPGAWWKFLVAHEIGHAVQQYYVGFPTTFNYDEVIDQNHRRCRCDQVSTATQHCLNSQEGWTEGAAEGWAHSIADKTFNDNTEANATFAYYKEFQNSDEDYDYSMPPQAKDGFGDPSNNFDLRWNWLKCSPTYVESGVEYDWMRFYYNISSQDSGRASTRVSTVDLFYIYRLACSGQMYGSCNSGNVQNLNSNSLRYNGALPYYGNNPSDPRYLRFVEYGDIEGVLY
jgi:hypothetical protein